jgi:hypothetical protein
VLTIIVGCAAIALVPAASRAIIIVPTHDPHDNRDVINQVTGTPRVVAFRREADALRKRFLQWKERDFAALFGRSVRPNTLGDALLTFEARALGLSGLHSSDPSDNKDHTEAYRVADLGHLVVYFGHDGQRPVHLLFYLKIDKDFPKLDRVENLERRLAWERPRFARLIREVERRWRKTVGWEIDPDEEKARSQGLESGDFAVKLRAVERLAAERGYTLRYEPPRPDTAPSWSWYQRDVPMVEAHHDRGYTGEKATPSEFRFYRPDGSLLRDERGWPSLEMIRWYRPDGERMAFVEVGALRDGAWRPRTWTWYDPGGKLVRQEADSNGDGIPDVRGESNLIGQERYVPMAVELSWAVNPGLIPERLRNPGQPERRMPMRRIPE